MMPFLPPKSALDRHTRLPKPRKPPDRSYGLTGSLRNAVLLVAAASQGIRAQSSTSSAAALPTQSISVSAIPSLTNLPPLNASHPLLRLSFPPIAPAYLTFNLCALSSNSSLIPTVLVSTATSPSWDLGNRLVRQASSGGTADGGYNRRSGPSGDTWALSLDKGFGNWTYAVEEASPVSALIGLGLGLNGQTTGVSASGNVVVQVGVSASGPLHRLSGGSPFLGDTTASTALIFSPLLRHAPQTQPQYPNYTLPLAQITFATPSTDIANRLSSSSGNMSLVLVPTGSSPTNDGLDNSMCAVRAANTSTGGIVNARTMVMNKTAPSWSRVDGEEGYRVAWGVGDLVNGGANYTAWVIEEGSSTLSKPIWLATKDAGFNCPIVMPNPTCPSIAYAAPISPDPNNATHPLPNLPDNLIQNLTANLNAFSTSLLSTACGRDLYSYSSSCLDCYTAYRDWLCRVLVPRCTSNSTAANSGAVPAQIVHRTADQPRLADVPLNVSAAGYDELLPCLSTCNAVDRACPVFLNFRCPLRQYTAGQAYAFVGDRVDRGDGAKDSESPAADRWGNAWCNG